VIAIKPILIIWFIWDVIENIHIKRKEYLASLPPKELASKHEFTSHQKLAIKKYIIEFPICSLQQIISALELDVHKSTLCRYLQYQNIE
jgi:hypothetical protein